MPPGRRPDAMHRRMRTILGTLAAHQASGVTRSALMKALNQDPANASHRRVIFRDIKALRDAGWHIESAKVGDEDRFTIRIVDPRLRAAFTEAERAQLLRAARRAGLGEVFQDLDPTVEDGDRGARDDSLAVAQLAIARHCLLQFRYSGRERTLHPYDIQLKPGGWRLRGLEEQSGQVKVFRLELIEELDHGLPGTARPAPVDLPDLVVDPMLRREHEPLQIEVRHAPEHTNDVVTMLGAGGHVTYPLGLDAMSRTVVTVTYLDAFIDRLLELEQRVELVAPEQARTALRDRLRAGLSAGSVGLAAPADAVGGAQS